NQNEGEWVVDYPADPPFPHAIQIHPTVHPTARKEVAAGPLAIRSRCSRGHVGADFASDYRPLERGRGAADGLGEAISEYPRSICVHASSRRWCPRIGGPRLLRHLSSGRAIQSQKAPQALVAPTVRPVSC